MSRKTLAAFTIVVIAMAASTTQAAYSPAITVNSSTTAGFLTTAAGNYGFDFQVNSTTSVNQLGVYNYNGSTYAGQMIYLYDVTTNTLLASVAETAPFSPNAFNYVGLVGGANVTLLTGQTYSIYATFLAGAQLPNATLAFDPNVTNVLIGGQVDGFNSNGGSAPLNQGVASAFTVNFLQQPSAVPEPASLGMMGLGLAGVLLVRRRLARRAA